MDIKEFKKVKVVNKADSWLVSHAFALPHNKVAIMEVAMIPEEVLEDLNTFYKRGLCDFVSIDDEAEKKEEEKLTEKVVSVETGKEHFVFKPQDKSINVETIDTSGKGINVGFSKMDAVELLGKHWKTLEKEIDNISNLDNLKLVLATAKELDMEGNKKYKIIKDKIDKLS